MNVKLIGALDCPCEFSSPCYLAANKVHCVDIFGESSVPQYSLIVDIILTHFYDNSMDQHALNNFCISSGIDLIVLFGSASKGTECQESDIDIAVKMRAGSIISKLDLINEMGKLFDDREIDLVVLSVNTDPVLLYEVFSYGKPLYESLPDLFANERLRAFNLYFDTEKLRRLQSEHLKDFVERFRNVA